MKIDKRIIPLAIGGLGIGTTEFTVMGLLPDIAKTLQITIPQAGHLISAYAMGGGYRSAYSDWVFCKIST